MKMRTIVLATACSFAFGANAAEIPGTLQALCNEIASEDFQSCKIDHDQSNFRLTLNVQLKAFGPAKIAVGENVVRVKLNGKDRPCGITSFEVLTDLNGNLLSVENARSACVRVETINPRFARFGDSVGIAADGEIRNEPGVASVKIDENVWTLAGQKL